MKKLLVVLVFSLAACGQLAAPRPVDTSGGISDRFIYLYGLQASARGALADGILQGRISKERGRFLQDRLDTVRKDVDLALLVKDLKRADALEAAIKGLESEVNHGQ